MATIKKDTLHPENEPEVDIYPKTSIDQVENLQANLDALNGDIANANGEIANISANVETIANRVEIAENSITALNGDIANANGEIANISANVETIANRVEIAENSITALNGDIANANGEIANISANVETIANRVEIAENSITTLTTAYESYTDYTEVTNGFLLTYLSGRQIELPIKAGTNVTFSKYPGSNQIIINFTGGSVPENIALLDANNTFSGSNTFSKLTYFNNQIALDINPISFNDDTKNMSLVFNYNGFIKRFVDTGNVYSINIPNKTGTIALTTDIPTLADYPTTIFFNNYKAGIGYKDTSTDTIKTVVSTGNNGAQIVIGDSNTGLTLATNARPKVLEDSTVKEVAYVSDIPNTSSFATLAGNNKWTGDNIFDGFSKSIRVNGLFQVSGDEELISATYNQVSYDGFNIAYMDGENQNIFHIGIDFENKARFGFDKYDGSSYNLYIPEKDGTIALLSDIPNTSSFPTLVGTNIWTGSNIFDNSITTKGNLFVSNGITSYTVNAITRKGYIYTFPDDTGTFALTKNIPTRPQYLQGFGIGTPTDFSFETGIYHTLTITLIDNYKSTSIIIPNDYDGTQIDLDIDGDYFEVTLVNEKLSVKNTTSNRSWLGKLE
jgi:hypothetical protein